MSNEEVIKNNDSGRSFSTVSVVQIILIVAALIITVVGLIRNADIYRAIIYSGQCILCVLVLITGIFQLKAENKKILNAALYLYVFLEALRAALLNTTGIHHIVAIIARLILILLACNCVLLTEKLDKKTALGLVILEILLYVVFLTGFPGVMLGRMNRFMPLAGVLIAGSVTLLMIDKEKE
ncbi:hypothetical protein [Butyrivibrio sp. VCD2006]|uniref:hypothetical protein n=1 Tax=Butyrivibrio sp. VCD2006 TaxID=1280664 RepID=UPI000407EBA8|nr:hypothetical protein [Butyrivibrio sp. VCD2006]